MVAVLLLFVRAVVAVLVLGVGGAEKGLIGVVWFIGCLPQVCMAVGGQWEWLGGQGEALSCHCDPSGAYTST